MKIRKTQAEDLDAVLAVYAHAREFMAQNGNAGQWGTEWPPRDVIEADIRAQKSYVCVSDGKIAAVFFFEVADDPTYKKIYDGAWLLCEKPYGVVHRIAADGVTKGAGSFCMKWAFSQCGNIRIDTHRNNIPMQNMLKKLGYHYCGIIFTHDGTERLAFQKINTYPNATSSTIISANPSAKPSKSRLFFAMLSFRPE